MAKKMSLQSKAMIVFFIALFLIPEAQFEGLGKLRDQVLRNETQAVAGQVVSFRFWVTGTGMTPPRPRQTTIMQEEEYIKSSTSKALVLLKRSFLETVFQNSLPVSQKNSMQNGFIPIPLVTG